MSIWTVHAPAGSGTTLEVADDLVFIREGFVWSAFLFAPIWSLAKRLWLAFVLWLAAIIAVTGLAARAEAPAIGLLIVILALWFGLEANNIRRLKLAGRGWRLVGVVEAPKRSEAERRYFARVAVDTAEAVATELKVEPRVPPGRRADSFPPVVGFLPGERS